MWKNNLLKGLWQPRSKQGVVITDTAIWPFFLYVFYHEYISANAWAFIKINPQKHIPQISFPRQGWMNKHLTGINHSAWQTVEMKALWEFLEMRTKVCQMPRIYPLSYRYLPVPNLGYSRLYLETVSNL